jgi:hypothetical protein
MTNVQTRNFASVLTNDDLRQLALFVPIYLLTLALAMDYLPGTIV